MRKLQRNPRHVYLAIRDQSKIPETHVERTLYVYLHGKEELEKLTPHAPVDELDPSVAYPFTVFNDAELRIILEAFLIATDDDWVISEATAMPLDEISAYRALFFDTSIFRTDLELIQYMRTVPDDSPGKQYLKIAFHQGVAALRWHFCRNKGYIDAEDVMKTIMTDSYFRSLEHRGKPITTTQAKEASKYAKIAFDCGKTLLTREDEKDNDTVDSLRIRFEEVRQNNTIEDVKEEILH